ncbi:hypothetical protein COOONC_14275, partial [Cooperia oncophora]
VSSRNSLYGLDILCVKRTIAVIPFRSKKAGGWRTLLIIWSRQSGKFRDLNDLNNNLNATEATEENAKKEILNEIARITDDMEAEFGAMGSLIRCGWRQTYFASQVKK